MAPDNKTKDQRLNAKLARKREVNGKIQKVTTSVEESRKSIARKKQRLATISNPNGDDADPDKKELYDSLKAEITKLDAEMMDWETELETLNKENNDIDVQDQDQQTGDGEGLFVPVGEPSASSNKSKGKPMIDLTGPEGGSTPVIIDDEEALFTPAQARKATGQNYDGEIVAWRQQDRSKPVIVRYGPQNAAKYERSTAAKEGNDFDEEKTVEFGPDHRLGDQKVAKKFVRKRRELLGIAGLAYNCDLKELEPKEKGETRRIAPLEILVKWEISGVTHKTWEIRSSIRHLFNSAKKADAYIFEAVKWHADRHQQWQEGQREAKERSPTPVPNSRLSPTPELPEVKTEGGSNGSPLAATNSSAESKSAERAAMLQYQQQWCNLKGIEVEKLDTATEMKFLMAWNAIKDTL